MTKRWPFWSPDIIDRLADCVHHGDLGSVDGHPAIEAFEQAFAARLNGVRRTIFFNSGTSAFAAGLFALDLRRGAEVVVPRQTFRACATPLLQFGLRPRFAECDPHSGLVTPESVRAALTDDTQAVVVTHQWGCPAEIEDISRLAVERGLRLIEDCSHAHGGESNGVPLGTFGDVAFFSCGTTKLVTGGTGGILAVGDSSLWERAMLFGQPKKRCQAAVGPALARVARTGVGVNLRGNPMAAVLAADHLRRLDELIDVRARNLRRLDEIASYSMDGLMPLPRPTRWTAGTWYKRPFALAPTCGDAAELLANARSVGLTFHLQDEGLDAALAPTQEYLGLRPVEQELGPARRGLVVFVGLELYSEDWDHRTVEVAFGQLMRLTSR